MTSIRSFVVLVLVVLCFALTAQAQGVVGSGYDWSSVVISSGENAISSGLNGAVRLKNEKNRTLEIVAQADQAWVLWGPEFKVGPAEGLIAGSVGFFQGAPWVGPFLSLNLPLGKIGGQSISVGTMQWPCLFFGVEPRNWRSGVNPESLWIGYLADFSLNIGPVGLTYSKLNFLDEPWNTIPGISFTQRVKKGVTVTGSVSRNMNTKSYMYYIGLNWSRK